MTDKLFAQHLPSNTRVFTDEYLVDTTSQFDYGRNREEIDTKKSFLEWIEVTDEQVAKVRGEYDEDRGCGYNSLTVGDAVALILLEEFRDYSGLEDPNDVKVSAEQESVPVAQQLKKKSKKIIDCYRDFDNLSTVYFLD